MKQCPIEKTSLKRNENLIAMKNRRAYTILLYTVRLLLIYIWSWEKFPLSVYYQTACRTPLGCVVDNFSFSQFCWWHLNIEEDKNWKLTWLTRGTLESLEGEFQIIWQIHKCHPFEQEIRENKINFLSLEISFMSIHSEVVNFCLISFHHLIHSICLYMYDIRECLSWYFAG